LDWGVPIDLICWSELCREVLSRLWSSFSTACLSISRTGVARAPAGSCPSRWGARRMRAGPSWTALDVTRRCSLAIASEPGATCPDLRRPPV
jgi:hypothetical protein